jgi:hypothetical protein
LHAATCNLLLRRRVLEKRGFREELFPGEDTLLTFELGQAGRLAFAADARVRHSGRTGWRPYLGHQRQLGVAFASVCEDVDFPYRRLARRRYAPLLPVFRLVAVARRVRGNPFAVRAAAAVAPLLVVGALAWTGGLIQGRGAAVARPGHSARMSSTANRTDEPHGS